MGQMGSCVGAEGGPVNLGSGAGPGEVAAAAAWRHIQVRLPQTDGVPVASLVH